MVDQNNKFDAVDVPAQAVNPGDDDAELIAMGYKPSFKREFTNIATISFAFSIMGMCSSIATTFNTPLTLGGPASVRPKSQAPEAVKPTIIRSCGAGFWEHACVSLLGPALQRSSLRFQPPVASILHPLNSSPQANEPLWAGSWDGRLLNMLGQVAGVSSTEFGLANMIWGAVVISKNGEKYVVTQGMTVGLMIALLVVHGILNRRRAAFPAHLILLHFDGVFPKSPNPSVAHLLYYQNSLATKWLARMTSGFVFVNVGATLLIIIVLLATTPRSEMHPAGYVFGSQGVINQTGGWNSGIAFLFGLLSVQWTMTDYDATGKSIFSPLFQREPSLITYVSAHISEEVQRAAVAAPSAIFIAVIGTGLIGWLLNIVLVLCSGPLENLPGPSGLAFLEIMYMRIGRGGALFLWFWVCLTAFFVVQTALQACSRTFYAFSRDHGLPDRGLFGKITNNHIPLYAVWLVVFLSILPGLLDLASPIAAQAIFALTAMALDLSYIVPIFCRRLFRNHPEVHFKPGPFYMGDGALGWTVNSVCIIWTIFVAIILAFPTVRPVTKLNMNYANHDDASDKALDDSDDYLATPGPKTRVQQA
ncbi:hypothetical protein FRC10_011929 [Ceratobasidium sp. 414]|nr:hypothetical protein FRC10_011929 [Ceratobasidium sp. 414]